MRSVMRYKIITRKDIILLAIIFLFTPFWSVLHFFGGLLYHFHYFSLSLSMLYFLLVFACFINSLIRKKFLFATLLIAVFLMGGVVFFRFVPAPVHFVMKGANCLLTKSDRRQIVEDALLLVGEHKDDINQSRKYHKYYALKQDEIPQSFLSLNCAEVWVYNNGVFLFKFGRLGYFVSEQSIYWNEYGRGIEGGTKLY